MSSHLPDHIENDSKNILQDLGGVEGLTKILEDFYHHVFKDPMIGYLFHKQDINRLVQRELEWTARLFGDKSITYRGRPLSEAHRTHPIRRGHFFRRNQILRQTLIQHHVSPEIIEQWMKHSEALIHAILGPARNDPRCEQTSMDPL